MITKIIARVVVSRDTPNILVQPHLIYIVHNYYRPSASKLCAPAYQKVIYRHSYRHEIYIQCTYLESSLNCYSKCCY